MAFSATIARPGTQVNVTDAPSATTYWWIATLAALEALLGGGSAPPLTLSVAFGAKHHTFVSAPESLTATSASYDGTTLTPPSISGSFTVPSGVSGKHKVFVSLSMPLDGFGLQITAEHYHDYRLLDIAEVMEAAYPWARTADGYEGLETVLDLV